MTTTTELRELMERANIETPVHDWRDASEIVDATGRGIAGASDSDRDYLIEAINALPGLLDVAEAARAYMEIRHPHGDLATTTIAAPEMDKRAVALMDALAGLEGGK